MAVSTTKNRNIVLLKSGREVDPLPSEAKADTALTPGMLLEITSTGVKKHATAGGPATAMFVKENSLGGDDIDDDIASGSQVNYWLCGPGDEVYAILTNDQSVAVGDYLESAGDGFLRKHVAESTSVEDVKAHAIVAQALEAKNTSTSTIDAIRIHVLIV